MNANIVSELIQTSATQDQITNLYPNCGFSYGGNAHIVCVNPGAGEDVTCVRLTDLAIINLVCDTLVYPAAIRLTSTVPE